ncbi:MAG: Cna B-type domain-containing protein, partial [Pygmaiobacter sp.]
MNKKRILSALLAVMMVFTILPVNVFATSPSDVKPANVAHEVVTNGKLVTDGTDKTGKVEIQKTAKALAGANEFQLTLTAKGSSVTTQIPGADIVMVLDKSGSMGESGMASLKAAATTFLTTVLATGNDNRVSIVNYDTLPKSATAWYTSTEADLARAISKIATESNGGTNTQGGLYLARQQLATSQAANKIIVLLSDGDPTYNVPTNLSGYTRDTTAKLEDYGTKVQFDYDEATSKKEGAGHKTTYTKEFRYNRRDKDITLNSGYAAIYESGLAKSVNTSVYSIGFKTNSTTLGILDSIASPATETTQYCYDAPDEATLKRVFGEIGQAIKDNTVGSGVSDILSADATKVAVQLDGSFKKATNANLTDGNYYANNGEVTYKEGTLSWSPTDVVKDAGAMLTYRVKMNVETANYDPSVVTPTNGVTTFGYKDYKETEKIAEFDVPTVKTVHGTIQRVGVLCDVNGNYLNAEGEIVTDPAAAQQLVLPEYVDNAVGKPYWNPDHTGITVNAPAAPANYVAYGNKTSETVDLVYSNDAATYNKIAYFPFYLNETSVTVTKLWNDENNAYGTRPTSIAVTIEGKSSDDSVTLNRTLTGDATASRWSASFDQLPLTDAHGHSYVYTVKSEAAVTGYTPTIAGTTVTNSLDGKTLTLNKVNETGEALPGASFTIKDLKTGKTSTETEQSFAIELAYGHIYEITENAPTGYTANAPFYVRAMQKVELVKQDGTVLSALTNVVLNGLTMKVTNVHKIDVSGTKTWADDKNEFHTRPESITLVLKQNGTALSVQPSWTKDNENNTWSYTFAGLDKQDATGKDYRYTVEESPVSGYQATVKGMDITNTLETAAIHFAKRNDSGEVMQGVSFTLSGNGTTRTEVSNDKGNVSFTGIPAGTYTLTETTPTGFVTKAVQTIVVAKNANGVLTVTMDGKPLNKVENIANTATVSLVKVGSDNENAVLSGAT